MKRPRKASVVKKIMTTTLLALDLIAPIIGSVVLTGACGFFSGILLGQGKQAGAFSGTGEGTFSNLESEIQRLLQDRITDRLESEFLDELVRQGELGTALFTFAEQHFPPAVARSMAFIVSDTAAPMPCLQNRLTKASQAGFKISTGLAVRLATSNPLMIRRDDTDGAIVQTFDDPDQEFQCESAYVTGFSHANEIVAVLVTSEPWPIGLDERDQIDFMNRLARRVSSRWPQMQHAHQTTTELQSMRNMLDLRRMIDAQSDDPLEDLHRFSSRLAEMVKADRGAVYFVARRAGESVQPIVQCGRELPEQEDSEWYQYEQTLAQIAIDSELGRLQDGEWLEQLKGESPIAAAITVPIRVNSRVLGVLCLTRQDGSQSFEPHRPLIEFAAETLSHTLRRVFDEASIRRQARHDHLTDLVNRRSFDAYLDAEIERVRQGETPLCSLIFADLDHFKSYNDRYGHPVGDQVLRDAARILVEQMSSMRFGETSVVARYGGEEFAILLPNIGEAGALRIAEQIRRAIESTPIRIPTGVLHLTVSLGVAECPAHGDSAEDLVNAADKALYKAKAKGRNTVCLATMPESVF